ncbi:MAG: hypothetical protein ACR2GI_05240 [Thermomicrobiales bacterium]
MLNGSHRFRRWSARPGIIQAPAERGQADEEHDTVADLPTMRTSSISPDTPHPRAVPFGNIAGGLRALVPATSIVGPFMGTILGLGFAIRLIASLRLSPHVDEASSVLAAHATAAYG